MFVGVGVAFAVGSTSYVVGSSSHMGPGYFPMMLGVLLTLLGIAITCQALSLKTSGVERIGSLAWRPLIFILCSNLIFGILLAGLPSLRFPPMGVILAIYALTIIASLASRQFKIREVLVLATVLAVGSFLVFIVLLKLQFPVWPAFIAR